MEAREHRDASLRLGREYLAVEPGGSVAGFSGSAPSRDPERIRPQRFRCCRRPPHVPPGQRPRVVGRIRHRDRAGPRADLVGDRHPSTLPRSAVSSTSRSAVPRTRCTCRGRTTDGRRAGPRPGPSPWLTSSGSLRPPPPAPVDPRGGLAGARSVRRAATWPIARTAHPAGVTPVDVLGVTGNHWTVPHRHPLPFREVAMARTTLPLFPTDDGWPYPDGSTHATMLDDTEPDLDALELHADRHAFDTLTPAERAAVVQHFGLDGKTPVPTQAARPTHSAAPAPKPRPPRFRHRQVAHDSSTPDRHLRADSSSPADRPSPLIARLRATRSAVRCARCIATTSAPPDRRAVFAYTDERLRLDPVPLDHAIRARRARRARARA